MNDNANGKRWILLFTIFLIVVTSIPYAIGMFFDKNPDWIFSGFIFGVEDGNSYIAKMLSGAYGDWLFRTPYTAYPQRGFLAFLPYLLIGKLASPPDIHLQLVLLFQLFRWAGIFFLVSETYKFVSIFIEQRRTIRLAVVLSLIGGGLGWIVIFTSNSIWSSRIPLEFYSPESFGFLSIFGLPHLCFSRALMLLSFRIMLKPIFESNPIKNHLIAGIYLLLSGIFQPLNIVLGWLVIASYKVVQFIKTSKKNFIAEVTLFTSYILFSLPFLIYNLIMFTFDPYLKTWEKQNIIKSPPFVDYIWAYGLGILCIIFIVIIKKQQLPNKLFLLVWLVIVPIMIYLPVNLQRRLSDGIWVVISIFIALAVSAIKLKYLKYLVVFLFLLSTIVVFAGSLSAVFNLNYPVYHDADLNMVFESIEIAGKRNDVVVANYDISNILPAYIPMRVVIGHGPESKNLFELEERIDQLFSNQLSDSEYLSFINDFQIKFIIYSKDEQYDNRDVNLQYPNQEIILNNEKFQVVKIN
jgi:hypothetical protein